MAGADCIAADQPLCCLCWEPSPSAINKRFDQSPGIAACMLVPILEGHLTPASHKDSLLGLLVRLRMLDTHLLPPEAPASVLPGQYSVGEGLSENRVGVLFLRRFTARVSSNLWV